MRGGETEPKVWIVDSEQWPRACLRAELIERGYDAVGYVECNQALAALSLTHVSRPRAIVLELRGQTITRSELVALAHSNIPVIILGGTLELNEPLIKAFNWAAVLRRPVTLGEVADWVGKVVDSGMTRSS